MRVYNLHTRNDNTRFLAALAIGIVAAFGLGICYGFVHSLLRIEFEYLYLLIGYAIAMVVQYVGRGVSIKYNILGAVLCVLAVFIGDIVSIFGFGGLYLLMYPSAWLSFVQTELNSFRSMWGVISLLLRVSGVYIAYMRSTVL